MASKVRESENDNFICVEWRGSETVIGLPEINVVWRIKETGVDCKDRVCWTGREFAPFVLNKGDSWCLQPSLFLSETSGI